MEAYELLKKQGYVIHAAFMETNDDFCGYWHDGEVTVYENVSECLEDVPEYFHFYFCEDDFMASLEDDAEDNAENNDPKNI